MRNTRSILKTLSLFLVLGLAVMSTGCSNSSSETPETGNETETPETGNETETETAPTLTAFTGSIAENAAAGTSVGTITANAGDSAITAITLAGTGNENFVVDTAGNITVSSSAVLDYETTTSYDLSAIATSTAGDSDSVVVTINITDVFSPLEIAKIAAIDGLSGDSFGSSVAASGDYIVVGASGYGAGGSEPGSAYLFKVNMDNGTVTQTAKLTANDAAVGDYFGGSVAISNDYIVVGANKDDDEGTDSGSAYLFKINTGDDTVSQTDKLTASDGDLSDGFGISVAISNDYIVVGASDDDHGANSGSAYLFKINTSDDTVTQTAKLTANDAAEGDYFGNSVAISGNYIVLTADRSDEKGDDSGAAYLFKINTGDDTVSQIAKLTASDGEGGDYFGSSVAIADDYIVIGAEFDDHDDGERAGSAYLFKINAANDTASEVAKLTANDGVSYDFFGWSTAIADDYIVVGSLPSVDDGNPPGSAYLFNINTDDDTVSQTAKLTASDGEVADSFGWSVAILGDYLAVSAIGDDDNEVNSGSAYITNLEPYNRPYWQNYLVEIAAVEGISDVYTVLTNSINTGDIIVSLSGVDANNFTIVDDVITVVGTLDSASPADSDGDNIYEITVELEDAEGKTYSYDTSIKVTEAP